MSRLYHQVTRRSCGCVIMRGKRRKEKTMLRTTKNSKHPQEGWRWKTFRSTGREEEVNELWRAEENPGMKLRKRRDIVNILAKEMLSLAFYKFLIHPWMTTSLTHYRCLPSEDGCGEKALQHAASRLQNVVMFPYQLEYRNVSISTRIAHSGRGLNRNEHIGCSVVLRHMPLSLFESIIHNK